MESLFATRVAAMSFLVCALGIGCAWVVWEVQMQRPLPPAALIDLAHACEAGTNGTLLCRVDAVAAALCTKGGVCRWHMNPFTMNKTNWD